MNINTLVLAQIEKCRGGTRLRNFRLAFLLVLVNVYTSRVLLRKPQDEFEAEFQLRVLGLCFWPPAQENMNLIGFLCMRCTCLVFSMYRVHSQPSELPFLWKSCAIVCEQHGRARTRDVCRISFTLRVILAVCISS